MAPRIPARTRTSMVTREWLAGEVGVRLATPLTLATMANEDEPGALKEPLDDALRRAGYAEDALANPAIPDHDGYAMVILAKWTTLQAVRLKLIGSFDITSEGTSLRLNQRLKNVETLLKDAERDVIQVWGAIPSGADDGSGGVVSLNLNYLSQGSRVVSRDWPYTTVGVGGDG